MKKVAGPLRIEYAQYRELASFAQFGSDLDDATKAQLAKGERVVELLKQDQYAPMKVEHQVLAIYAITNDYAANVPVEMIKDYEKGLIEYADLNYGDTLEEIKGKGGLSDEVTAKMKEIIEKFTQKYLDELKNA
jgi:F-type H+-transporting ATPase subunit alpha